MFAFRKDLNFATDNAFLPWDNSLITIFAIAIIKTSWHYFAGDVGLGVPA